MKVAEYKSFSKAAEEIPCSQSSVSRQVKLLENELNTTLLLRRSSSSRVELTAAGKDILPGCEQILAEYEDIKKICRIAQHDAKAGSSPDEKLAFGSNIFSRQPTVLEQIEKLADLKEKGILTEEEFLGKKTYLLDKL